ncbi:MAG TPA: acyltransferase [Xanthobacteraceae bacterium]|nr:acyltransferase [Xanthobacteraceae bacterium]
MGSGGAYFPGVNALRGLAALLVVVQHAGSFAAQATNTPQVEVLKLDFAMLGVLMFFTISGFVIGLNRHLPTAEFLVRRALRIYPPFWAAYALSAVIVWSIGLQTNWSWVAALLLPSRATPAIYLPLWTLIFEVFFYALAAFAFSLRLSDRALTALALCWIIVIANMNPYLTGMLPILPGALIPFTPYNIFFAFGLICALNFEVLSRYSINQCLAVTVAATVLMVLMPPVPHIATTLVMAIAQSSLLMAVTKLDRWASPATFLGNASYGLFLLHVSAMAVAASLLKGTGLSVGEMWVVLFFIGLAVGVPYGLAEFAFHRAALHAALPLFGRKQAQPEPAGGDGSGYFDDRRGATRSRE